MKYRHSFVVNAPVEKVLAFYLDPRVLASLTPLPAVMRIGEAPARLQPGERFAFTLWMGPIPVRWESVFPEVTANGFVDIQGRGPFQSWEHRHQFIQLDAARTEVIDEIEARLRWHPWHALTALMMWLPLPLLFAYRERQTRRRLEQS